MSKKNISKEQEEEIFADVGNPNVSDLEIIEKIKDLGSLQFTLKPKWNNIVMESILHERFDLVKKIISDKEFQNFPDFEEAISYKDSLRNRGNSSLTLLIKSGELNLATDLVAAGANPNIISDCGKFSPLHLAAMFVGTVYDENQGAQKLVRTLIEKGASLNSKDPWGRNPLDYLDLDLVEVKENSQCGTKLDYGEKGKMTEQPITFKEYHDQYTSQNKLFLGSLIHRGDTSTTYWAMHEAIHFFSSFNEIINRQTPVNFVEEIKNLTEKEVYNLRKRPSAEMAPKESSQTKQAKKTHEQK